MPARSRIPTTGAIMTPVYMTSTYVQAGPGEHKGYEYSRTQNPTRNALQDCLAALEGAKYGLAFASGLAGTDMLMHMLEAGDHVVVSDDVYGGTFRIFDKVFKRHGLNFSLVDLSKAENFEKAITPKTKMVWVETPTNPMLKLIDLPRIAEMAKKRGILSVCDNTFMTPVLPASAGPGLRRGDALHHQVHQRPQRRGGRLRRAPATRNWPRRCTSCRTRWAACPAPWTASSCCAA